VEIEPRDRASSAAVLIFGRRALAPFTFGVACALGVGSGWVSEPLGSSTVHAQPAGAAPPSAAATRLGLGAPPPPPNALVGYDQSPDEIVAALASAEVRFLMPLGGSSGVLRMRVSERWAAVYRLRTHGRPDGPAAEVAAYRVARALGLDDVPPAVLRRMSAAEIRRLFSGSAEEWEALRRLLAVEADGSVLGAAIAYQTELKHLGLEQERRRAEWQGWLGHGAAIPESARPLARDLSRMIVFDYLVANRDRPHDPLRGPEDGSRIVLRNHDAAFGPLNDAGQRQLLAALRRSERFSRSMIAALAGLDREALGALLEDGGRPLLSDDRVEALLERRETVLSYVEALCERDGADDALFFP
jgi:hypothetical protein